MSDQTSLRIGLSDNPERARLEASAQFASELAVLRPKFRSLVQVKRDIVEVDLDDLLANIAVLGKMPPNTVVEWEPTLARLVKSSINDAKKSEQLLNSNTITDFVLNEKPKLGENWIGNLTPFQIRDLQKLLALGHGANFSVPGAGKTRVALALYAAMVESDQVERLLVVGPKSSFGAWETETAKVFRNPPQVSVFEGFIEPAAEILLINYERLDGALGQLSRWLMRKPGMLILDEAHRMKLGARGTYGRACLALGPKAVRRLILTGTPAPNGAADLENLMGFIWPGLGKQAVNRAVSGGDLRKASAALRPLYARTTKSELNLPPQEISIRRLELPPLHREIYDALITGFSARPNTSEDDLGALGKILMYLMMAATSPALLSVGTTRYEPLEYRVPPLEVQENEPLFDLMRDLPSYETSPKYLETVKIVEKNARLGRKTLIWSTFVRSLTTLEKLLAPYNPAMVHGGTENRDSQIDKFKKDSTCFVLLSNPATLGEGISLHHECHDAVYVDRDFAAGRYIQSLDRIHRLGLDPGVVTRVTVLSASGTIDEAIEERLRTKVEFMGKILDDPDIEELGDLDEEPSIAGGMDSGDIQTLLRYLNGRSS